MSFRPEPLASYRWNPNFASHDKTFSTRSALVDMNQSVINHPRAARGRWCIAAYVFSSQGRQALPARTWHRLEVKRGGGGGEGGEEVHY